MTERKYYQVGTIPVKLVPGLRGQPQAFQLSLETGEFELSAAQHDQNSDSIELLTEEAFIDRVEAIRSRRLTGEGPLYTLYAVMNGIEDIARDEKRRLTAEEAALVSQLRRQSYAVFEAQHSHSAAGDDI